MVMVHGDDRGIVLPPRVATTQVIVLPVGITAKTDPAISDCIRKQCQEVAARLNTDGIRATTDLAENQTPGWKFSHWELKGVPLRIEIGPKELDSETYSYTVRYDGTKGKIAKSDLVNIVKYQLDSIHDGMLSKARRKYLESIVPATNWDAVTQTLVAGKMCLIPWCEETSCERSIKERTSEQSTSGAKCLCIPFEQPFEILPNLSCPACSRPSKRWALFARSY
jgi:prolyl-tRNA synthetase